MTEFGPALQQMTRDRRFLSGLSQSGAMVASPKAADALQSVSRVFFPHEVMIRDKRDRLDFQHCTTSLGTISFNQIAYGADVDVLVHDLQRSHYVLVIALTGSATVDFNRGNWKLYGGDCVLMSPDIRYEWEMGRDHTHLAIGIPAHHLSGCGRPYEAVHNVMEQAHGVPQGGAAQLMTLIEYLCGELHRGSPLFELSAVISANESSFLAMLRAALFDRSAPAPPSPVLPGYVRRADRFIARHLTDNIELGDILAASGVPMRTLYNGFDRFLGYSPMRWLKLCRLKSARADLLSGDAALSVTAIVNKYWIGHSGRFASLYQELYGESPSATLERARAARSA